MPALCRRLFASVSVLSLMCCLATIAVWVRSHSCDDQLVTEWGDDSAGRKSLLLSSNYGILAFVFDDLRDDYPTAVNRFAVKGQFQGLYWQVFQPLDVPGVPAFRFWSGNRVSPRYRQVAVPHWFGGVLFAVLAASWLLRPHRRQSKRRKLGLWLNCGYDLRASPERCPECSQATVPKPAAVPR